ncbi:hypothetical protein CONCODRAFT_8951 [Conidiobolus coronatus NRRL 28638]|uniref:Uncharacterized protein n=1 Tax=Conidiobolus coronatus (strain ATCC 28846 / CBS 209.66 / NRRL 28638) TaxID=796925 RepID=A0A137P1I6_CONC2|nr:hypothetical protein CONCODRAFT_8951 [Conidiobolus coronatus NRRL 28638]|eukprot:KXN68741.1 hypothetical protein CONCODRAFT_8951 [Conidiobolus coronatus NRRL 28638]
MIKQLLNLSAPIKGKLQYSQVRQINLKAKKRFDIAAKNKERLYESIEHKLPQKSSFSKVILNNYSIRGEYLKFFDDKRIEHKRQKILKRAEENLELPQKPKILSQSKKSKKTESEEEIKLTNHIKKALHLGLNTSAPPHSLLESHYWRIYRINYSPNLKRAKIIYISTEPRVNPEELEKVIDNNLPYLNDIIRKNFTLLSIPMPNIKFQLGSEQNHLFDSAFDMIEAELNGDQVNIESNILIKGDNKE